jgi:PKHD-type hydroxylase
MFPGAIDSALCDAIITEGEYYQPKEAVIGNGTQVNEDKSYRTSEIRWINKNDTNSKFIADLIYYYSFEANRNTFDVDINYLQDIQYTKYFGHNKGHYNWHFDTFWASDTTAYDRKLSVTIQLSDPEDYKGGDFKFGAGVIQPDQEQLKQRGTVLVFLSPTQHMVEPVTFGERKSLVAWVEGPKWR